MAPPDSRNARTDRARSLRRRPTKSEGLLWALLRGRQVCGLKFRRQHPIGPYFADFACVERRLVVEIDGGYHDAVGQSDLQREAYLRANRWQIVRFTDEEVERDVEAVGRAIARHLSREYVFKCRSGRGAGIMHANAPDGPQSCVGGHAREVIARLQWHEAPEAQIPEIPSPAATASDPPEGG